MGPNDCFPNLAKHCRQLVVMVVAICARSEDSNTSIEMMIYLLLIKLIADQSHEKLDNLVLSVSQSC